MTILDPKTGLKVDLQTGSTRRPAEERGAAGARIEAAPKNAAKGPRDGQAVPAKPAR